MNITRLQRLYSPGTAVLALAGIETLFLCALLLHGMYISSSSDRLDKEAAIMNSLRLSDLCLTTEARHTRNIALPELMATFQDVPGYYDHFPSSSYMQPPPQTGTSAP